VCGIVGTAGELGRACAPRATARQERPCFAPVGSAYSYRESPANEAGAGDNRWTFGPSDANILSTVSPEPVKKSCADHPCSVPAQRTATGSATREALEGVFESEFFGHVRGAFPTRNPPDRVGRCEMAMAARWAWIESPTSGGTQTSGLLRVCITGERSGGLVAHSSKV